MSLRGALRSIPGARPVVRSLRRGLSSVRRQRWSVPDYYYKNAYKKIRIDRDLPGFSSIAARAITDGRTLLDYDRLYTIWQGLRETDPSSNIVEVGVYRGGSARFISDAMAWHGNSGSLFACDTFTGHAVVDPSVDGEHRVSDNFADVQLDDVRAYLGGRPNLHLVVGNIMDRAADIPDTSVGLMHLDVDVYPATKFCLDRFHERVAVGGVIVVDDYGFTTCVGARLAVDEFVAANSHWRFFHLLTGQALLVKAGAGAPSPVGDGAVHDDVDPGRQRDTPEARDSSGPSRSSGPPIRPSVIR